MNFEKFEQQPHEKQDSILAAGIQEFAQKSYSDASTDCIVKTCEISKGLLFHYFGSKKEFYLYCLTKSLERILDETAIPEGSFYEILFGVMNHKLQRCAQFPFETKFVTMASRESALEVAAPKAEMFKTYTIQTRATSAITMEKALATLSFTEANHTKAKEGLLLYCNTILNNYLMTYQNNPYEFFKNADKIQMELKEYLDLMLYGIIKEAQHEC